MTDVTYAYFIGVAVGGIGTLVLYKVKEWRVFKAGFAHGFSQGLRKGKVAHSQLIECDNGVQAYCVVEANYGSRSLVE